MTPAEDAILYGLHNAVDHFAPDGVAFKLYRQQYLDFVREAKPDFRLRVRYVAGVLFDGTSFGNWPWPKPA